MVQITRATSLLKVLKAPKNGNVPPRSRFLSYFHAPGKHSLSYKTIGGLLDESAEKFGDVTAYVSVYQDKTATFREVKEQADALAAGVLECGLEKGDRVGIWASNSLEWYITSLALAKAGLISVYLNPSFQASELKHCLNAVDVKMLFISDSFKTQNNLQILNEAVPEISKSEFGKLSCSSVPSLRSVVSFSELDKPGINSYKRLADTATNTSRKKLKEISQTVSPEEASNIQFTSGTTGSPKGAVLNHFNVVNNAFLLSVRQELHLKKHIMCFMGPLYHAMGSVIGMLSCLHHGITFVVPDVAFSASKTVSTIMSEKPTILLGTPTMYVDVLKIMSEKGLKADAPEIAISGGAYASSSLFNDVLSILGVKRVVSVYGLTEAGPVTFMSRITDDREKMLTTVGYVMDHTEAKVVDEKGRTVPWDAPGELWVRGYNIMKGYWNNEQKTKETVTPEVWLRTGDRFALSAEGYGKIVGRIKDMIIRGGENIFPAEIEEFLSTHPSILQVEVVGLPDGRLGEQVCACIRVKPDASLSDEKVKEFCKGKIAPFKTPHYVYFVDEFPKTASGKVQKFILRKQAMDHFKLQD